MITPHSSQRTPRDQVEPLSLCCDYFDRLWIVKEKQDQNQLGKKCWAIGITALQLIIPFLDLERVRPPSTPFLYPRVDAHRGQNVDQQQPHPSSVFAIYG